MNLNEQLEVAIAKAVAKKEAYGVAALAAQENGTAGARQLKDATKALQEAETRVTELRAAIDASEERARAQQAALEAEAAEFERAALNAAIKEIQRSGAAWDAALDALASATQGLVSADATLRRLIAPAGVLQKMEQARSRALLIIAYRLRQWSGDGEIHPAFREEHLSPLLPATW
jgi:predicted  nucleic acid-binding Zn-ribbon protein